MLSVEHSPDRHPQSSTSSNQLDQTTRTGTASAGQDPQIRYWFGFGRVGIVRAGTLDP